MGKDWKKHKYIRKEGSRYIYKDTKNTKKKYDYRDEAELLNNVLSDMDQRTLVRETGRYLKNKVTRGKDGITRPTKTGDAIYSGLTKITDAENNNKLKKKMDSGAQKVQSVRDKAIYEAIKNTIRAEQMKTVYAKEKKRSKSK